jgi:ribosome biogenesis protein MAK21
MEEHVEALYRIVHTSPPAAATQALMLLFHLNIGSSSDQSTSSKSTTHTTETNKQDRFYRALYAKLSDHSMFAGRQVTLFFNLLYKSMKNDSDPVRIVAFAKRLLHTATQNNAAVCSGSLFLLSEVGRYQPCIHESMTMCRNNFAFDCTKREPRGAFHPVESSDVATVSLTEVPLSKSSLNGTLALDKTSSLWELSLCLSHYHPTVVKFANSMSDIKYDGDPLRDVTLAHFLDKFSFRNPKSVDKIAKNLKRGESIGEKRSGIEGRLTSLSSFPVNSPEFWSQNGLEDVSGSDDFFKKFFTERSKRDELKGIIRGKKDDDDGDDALDIAEGREVDFDGDDTDSEEEAFVQRLAQQLMDTSGNKRAHYDEEDPDMNDWDDLNDGEYADEDKIHNEVEDEEVDDESSVEGGNDGSIASVNSESDGSFHTDKLVNSLNSRVMKGKVSVFAAAEDYDEMISKSISRGKRSFVDGQESKELSRKKRY